MIRPTTLDGWLAYLETLHPKSIALGLERVAVVHARMAVALACPVVTVTGTNGKGSTCAMLETVLRCAGHGTGLYTSPHLMRYNERVRVRGEPADDATLIRAFNDVEDARDDVPLTYFEYGTLAALSIFARAGLDVVILEVGLGGRLDAVNVVDADVAIVTSVDLDHMDYLGPTREDIGREKAGIFRSGHPVVCAEPEPPSSMIAHAAAVGAPVFAMGRDYGFVAEHRQWRYWGPGGPRHGLPFPALQGEYQLANAATVLAALDLLRDRLHVAAGAVRDGLITVDLPGRFQVLPGRPLTVLDVAHNPHAARALVDDVGLDGSLPGDVRRIRDPRRQGCRRRDRRRANADRSLVRRDTALARAARVRPPSAPRSRRPESPPARSDGSMTSAAALDAARDAAGEADRIIVFGSFLTVAAALAAPRSETGRAPRNG